jgi:hypothetical protein
MLTKVAGLLPTHTRRSEESQALQQFSTPVPLGFCAAIAAAITPSDLVLEPSAGTGLLAIMTELAGGSPPSTNSPIPAPGFSPGCFPALPSRASTREADPISESFWSASIWAFRRASSRSLLSSRRSFS